jgi:hypothetical protein
MASRFGTGKGTGKRERKRDDAEKVVDNWIRDGKGMHNIIVYAS